MAPVQMNVRIERELKLAGDAAFEEIGYTPTEVVREVWGFAKRNRNNRRAMNDLMRSLRDPREVGSDEETQRAAEIDEWLDRGSAVIREACARYGVDISKLPPATCADYDELIADELEEKLERMGKGI